MLAGIVVGNMAIWKMIDLYDESLSTAKEMFSVDEETTPYKKRAEAGSWYREKYPDGPLTKMLRIGQAVTVLGFVLMFALLAIK